MTRTPKLMAAALAAWLLAAMPAVANQLLNGDWIARTSYEQVQKAITAGADPNAQDANGHTPLVLATWRGNLPAMEALLEAGVDPNRLAPGADRVAMHVAFTGEAVALLFDYGASVSVRGEKGTTPLHEVASHGTPAAVQALIRRGADVNAVNRSNATPLHKAARNGTGAVLKVLLDAGADPTIHANNRYVSSMVPSPAEAARGNRKLRGHPVMARLEVGMTTASPAEAANPGCDGYIVQASDRRLGDVAEKVLGDRARWTEIARLNGITAQAPHRVGQCLALP